MPLADLLDLADWPALRRLAQALAGAEPVFGSWLPVLTVLTGLGLALYLSLLGARDARAWWLARRLSRLGRLLAKFRRVRERIADRGRLRRQDLVLDRQRRDLEELAELVREQLRTAKWRLPPELVRRARRAVARLVADLDFDRLYALHRLLARTGDEGLASRLEARLRHGR